jgi:hypothetical protein
MKSSVSNILSYGYLFLVPIITAGLGFGVGHVSYQVYLPIWLLNALIMIIASWSIGLRAIQLKNKEQSQLAKTAFFLIVPWILISMFAGMGPPPETATEWTNTIIEQQIRYFLLVISGIFIAFGFAGLRESLKSKGEIFYSVLSLTAILIAIPLFIINMLYWGFYLSEYFKIQAATNVINHPDWFLPMRQLFGLISVTEVALTYFATFMIAIAFRKVGWLGKTSTTFYVLFSVVALIIIILSAIFTELFRIPGFAVSIPAIPLIMPYYFGVNLLRKIGSSNIDF